VVGQHARFLLRSCFAGPQQWCGARSLAVGLPAAGLRARGHLAGAHLPPSRASPGMTLHGVPVPDTHWPVRASLRRERVRERLYVLWRRPTTP
jgi:hypothetical protein